MKGYNEFLGRKKGIDHKKNRKNKYLLFHPLVENEGNFMTCVELQKFNKSNQAGIPSYWSVEHAFLGGMSKDGQLLWSSGFQMGITKSTSITKQRLLEMHIDNQNRLIVYTKRTSDIYFRAFSKQGKLLSVWTISEDDFDYTGTWFTLSGLIIKSDEEENVYVFFGRYFPPKSRTQNDKSCFLQEMRCVLPKS